MWHLETQNTETQSPQQFPNWRIVAEAFDLDHFPNKRDRISERVNEFFWEKDIISRDIDSAHNNTDTNFIEITIWEEIYYFDIYSEQYCGMSLDEANAFREAHPNPEIQVMLEWIPLLEQVMENNSWYLNSDDIIDFDAPEAFSWMTARELQMTIRWNIRTFHKNWGLLWIDDTQKEKIVWLYQIYLEIIMGIGDTFEDGSDEFHKTDGEIDMYLKSVMYSFSTPEECLDYYVHIQTQIYENRSRSKKNKEACQIFSEKLWRFIFERFQREFDEEENPENKQWIIQNCITFIKLITERSDVDINNDLRDPLLAEEVCIFIISRPGWVLDSLENCSLYSLDFTDPLVWERSPSDVVSSVEQKLQASWISTLEHKREVSILARLIEKIDNGDLDPEELSDMDESEVSAYIISLWTDITHEAYEAVREAYDKNFEATSYGWRPIYTPPDFMSILQDIWVSPEDIEAFELFDDIRWNSGYFNYSDENLNLAWSLGRSAWIIVWTIAVVMLATAVTWWYALPAIAPSLIAAWWWLTTTWSLTAIWTWATMGTAANMLLFDPRTHDSFWEMLSDTSTDFVINTFHAVYMERLTMRLWKWSSNLWRAWLLWGDLSSGIAIEVIRDDMIDAIFQWESLLWGMHNSTIEDIFWWIGYFEIESHITPELENRFANCTHIFYLWNWYDVDIELESEFQSIDWSVEEILTALNAWMERQEERIS